jgi:hypothetical protein
MSVEVDTVLEPHGDVVISPGRLGNLGPQEEPQILKSWAPKTAQEIGLWKIAGWTLLIV